MTACHKEFDCDILSQSARMVLGRAQNILCFQRGIIRPVE